MVRLDRIMMIFLSPRHGTSWDLVTEVHRVQIPADAVMLPYSPCILHSDQRVTQAEKLSVELKGNYPDQASDW